VPRPHFLQAYFPAAVPVDQWKKRLDARGEVEALLKVVTVTTVVVRVWVGLGRPFEVVVEEVIDSGRKVGRWVDLRGLKPRG
jgi:hypothetical protein